MRAFGPAERLSLASRIPPAMPTSISADRTSSVAGANGGNAGNSLPKSCGLAGAPGPNLGRMG